jgi:hypothetical protein
MMGREAAEVLWAELPDHSQLFWRQLPWRDHLVNMGRRIVLDQKVSHRDTVFE